MPKFANYFLQSNFEVTQLFFYDCWKHKTSLIAFSTLSSMKSNAFLPRSACLPSAKWPPRFYTKPTYTQEFFQIIQEVITLEDPVEQAAPCGLVSWSKVEE